MSPNELEGDLNEWGEDLERAETGIKVLGYPNGSQGEFSAFSGRPPQPDYFPKGKIKALNRTIWGMETKYQNILICFYALKIKKDTEIAKQGVCHRNSVKKWLSEAKHILVKSRYWKA